MLIVVEGVDGSGKDTVAAALAEHLGGRVMDWYATDTGRAIKALLRCQWEISPGRGVALEDDGIAFYRALTIQALWLARRLEAAEDCRVAMGSKRVHLILPRATPSAYVYGCAIDGLPLGLVDALVAPLPVPDLSLLLDVSSETGIARRAARDGAKPPELYESSRALLRRAAEAYLAYWAEPPADGGIYDWVDAEQPLEAVVVAAKRYADDVLARL